MNKKEIKELKNYIEAFKNPQCNFWPQGLKIALEITKHTKYCLKCRSELFFYFQDMSITEVNKKFEAYPELRNWICKEVIVE